MKTFQHIFCQNILSTLQCSTFQKLILILKTSKTWNSSPEYHPIAFTIALDRNYLYLN